MTLPPSPARPKLDPCLSHGGKPTLIQTFYIRTYGCQMNVYDSDRMADILARRGARRVDSAAEADLIVVNTCHIREKAAEKVYSELGRLAKLRARGERLPLFAVAGCVAQGEGREVLRRAPQVDLLVGPQALHRLDALLDALEAEIEQTREATAIQEPPKRKGATTKQTALEFPTVSKFDFLPEEMLPRGASAYLAVQEGCDRLCTFCVVPYTRGPEFSRPPEQVVAEAERLCGSGVVELTLLGQNVNAYAAEDARGKMRDFAFLLEALHEVPGLHRIRYTTSHPLAVSDSLIAAHRDLPKLPPFLHLPVQSGSDTVLAAMNRRHTRRFYLERCEALRRARPDLALSSDFIVGFPGESDQDFADTLSLVREVKYARAYAFVFSPRPGTPAANLSNTVPRAVAMERLAGLQQLLEAQQAAFNRACVGSLQEVLPDGDGRRAGQLHGRGPYMQSVAVEAEACARNTFAQVRITDAGPRGLLGHIESQARKTESAQAA